MEKIDRLDEILRGLKRVLVAYSGGVDSTALAHACGRVLGAENVLLVTAVSESLAREELEDGRRTAAHLDLPWETVRTREIEKPGYTRNASDRCFFCKEELFEHLLPLAKERGFPQVAYGEIADDCNDHRPGARAARAAGIRAPLAEAGLSKEEIRAYLREHEVPVSEKPSFACLASRVAYGIPVSAEILARIERCESVLRRLGYRQFRVRHHGDIARIELDPAEIARACGADRETIQRELRAAGYAYVTIDLQGYCTGSMNRSLDASTLEGREVSEVDR